jgi:hypothetical protein
MREEWESGGGRGHEMVRMVRCIRNLSSVKVDRKLGVFGTLLRALQQALALSDGKTNHGGVGKTEVAGISQNMTGDCFRAIPTGTSRTIPAPITPTPSCSCLPSRIKYGNEIHYFPQPPRAGVNRLSGVPQKGAASTQLARRPPSILSQASSLKPQEPHV